MSYSLINSIQERGSEERMRRMERMKRMDLPRF